MDFSSNPTSKQHYQSSVPLGGDSTTLDIRGKVKYDKLGNIVCDTEDQINFYGVIIDAGHPFRA